MDNSEEYEQLETYSSASSDEDEDVEVATKKKRAFKNWIFVQEFETKQAAQNWIKEQAIWSYLKDYDTEAGIKHMYRCNQVKRRGPQCEAEICLQCNSHNFKVCLLENGNEHTHEQIIKEQKKCGINA